MHNRVWKTLLIFALLIATSAASADTNSLASSINELLTSPKLKHGVQGVVVESLSTGTVLYERNRDLVFIPASNFKLLVSAAILDRLGPESKYVTGVYRSGVLAANGTLNGDLFLVGGGDPVLSGDDLAGLAKQVRAAGIRRVTGAVIADESRFDNVRLGEGWAWSDEPFYYSPEISALDLDENAVQVFVEPGEREGNEAKVRLAPPTDYLRVSSTAKTGAPTAVDTGSVDRVHGRNVVQASGIVPMGKKSSAAVEKVSIGNPALYAAATFVAKLRAAGVSVAKRPYVYAKPTDAVLVAEHRSPPLSELLQRLLKPSDNLIAEVFLKTLGAEVYGKGTTEAGVKAEWEFLKKAGLDMGAISIVDGSGLSRRDYISPANLVTLLRYMWAHPNSRVFVDALPIAGLDGTLHRRMNGTVAQGNVRAKTGYLNHVSCLSGYVTTASGEPLVFSIMLNGHLCPNSDATGIEDKICELLAGYR